MSDRPSLRHGYLGVHYRLRVKYGPATDHLCSCGDQALQWAYQHTGDPELTDLRGPYSENLNDYKPMCRSCHAVLDAEHRGAQPNYVSGVRGVSWHHGTGKWRVQVKHRGKTYSGGYFRHDEQDKAEQAAIALREQILSEGVKA
jgi:hypothetical protein